MIFLVSKYFLFRQRALIEIGSDGARNTEESTNQLPKYDIRLQGLEDDAHEDQD
jgi:hypothetical protein